MVMFRFCHCLKEPPLRNQVPCAQSLHAFLKKEQKEKKEQIFLGDIVFTSLPLT